MKKIILALCAAVCCNNFNASVVNTVMSDFETQNKTADNGKSKIWYSSLNYKRPLLSTKNGNKTKDINTIAQKATREALNRFNEHIQDSGKGNTVELSRKIHNALVKYLRSANREVIYVYEPTGNEYAKATKSVSMAKTTKDYTIIPVSNGSDPLYIEIIAKRKNLLIRRKNVDTSCIIIKITQPDEDSNSRVSDSDAIDNEEE